MTHIFKTKGVFIAVIVVAVVALILCAMVAFEWYPIGIVEGNLLFAREYHARYELAYNYYDALSKASQASADEQDLEYTLRAASIEAMIDDVFVAKKLEQDFGRKELKTKIEQRIEEAWSDEQLRNDLQTLLKVSDSRIKSYFIAEQARYELLNGQLSLEGKNLFEWMDEQRKSARVKLFLKGFTWTQDGVTI